MSYSPKNHQTSEEIRAQIEALKLKLIFQEELEQEIEQTRTEAADTEIEAM